MQLTKAAIFTAMALLFTNQAMAAVAEERSELSALEAAAELESARTMIACGSYYACNAPNNGKKKEGNSCRFYDGPSDNAPYRTGHCRRNKYTGKLYCV